MDTFITFTGLIVFAFLLIFGVAFIYSIPVYFCWNAVVPKIFGLPYLNFWDSFILSLLCSFLFKSYQYTTSGKK